MDKTYWVNILASRSRNLYTGVTNSLERRLVEHRDGIVPGFTSKYRIFRLVYFETFGDIRIAIAREKEIKGWRREKKVWLIRKRNPHWDDLAAEWFAQRKAQQARIARAKDMQEKQIPHPRSQGARPGSG